LKIKIIFKLKIRKKLKELQENLDLEW